LKKFEDHIYRYSNILFIIEGIPHTTAITVVHTLTLIFGINQYINVMGKREKVLVLGFVALTASASAFAHFYTMKEGYALKAKKQLEKSKNNLHKKDSSETKELEPKAPTVGGVWGNITKMREAGEKN
jgi:hypothetical protein